jgi:sec-independent protein translocase protein TatB
MLDVAPQELLLVAVVALLVIGPKDLPKAMRFVGKWVGKARGIARQFRSGIDTMIRESELAEMEKQWAAENERIMREHPPTPSLPAPELEHFAPADTVDAEPVMVEQPALFSEPAEEPAPKPKRTRKPKTATPDEPQS